MALVVVAWPTGRVVAQWPQPPSINYGSYDPYTLSIIERELDFSTFPPRRRHNIFVHRGNSPDYGHAREFECGGPSGDEEKCIQSCTVQWSPTDVTLVRPDNTRVVISKESFIGGR